nr:MAG TPA: hypothetical protein [Caudoviricetes sp.]
MEFDYEFETYPESAIQSFDNLLFMTIIFKKQETEDTINNCVHLGRKILPR